jgi:hypothetical protein
MLIFLAYDVNLYSLLTTNAKKQSENILNN